MTNIRVAMIAPPWLPVPPNGYGGIENVLAVLIPELLKLGVEVELFTTGDTTIKATKKHHLYKTGQYSHIHRPQYDSVPITVAHLLYTLNIIERDGTFDIIHDHNNSIGPLALSFTHHKLPPTLHTLHNPRFTTSSSEESMDAPDNTPMWRQFKASKKLYFVGISKALTATAPAGLRRRMLRTIHNGVDVKSFPFVAKKDDYFITLARFHPEKGQAVAAKACADLDYPLKMAGVVGDIKSPKRLLLELANPLSSYRSLLDFRYYSDNIFPYLHDGKIEYIGEVSGPRKLRFISHARALLFPIQWDEPFGMAPIEALACGTPVVAMSRGALPEIIEHGVNGFLAKNVTEFKQFMKRIDEIDPQACRESVERNFSAQKMAKEYLKAYKKIIAKHNLVTSTY